MRQQVGGHTNRQGDNANRKELPQGTSPTPRTVDQCGDKRTQREHCKQNTRKSGNPKLLGESNNSNVICTELCAHSHVSQHEDDHRGKKKQGSLTCGCRGRRALSIRGCVLRTLSFVTSCPRAATSLPQWNGFRRTLGQEEHGADRQENNGDRDAGGWVQNRSQNCCNDRPNDVDEFVDSGLESKCTIEL